MSDVYNKSIAVCDLCINNEIHETVNLGFLYGLCLLHPKQDVFFYADEKHQTIIKKNIKNKGLKLEQIKYIHIPSNLDESYWGYLLSYLRIKKILDDLLKKNLSHLLVLSSVSFQRLILKYLLKRKCYQKITCSFVMHGDLDDLISTKHKTQEVAGTYFKVQEVAGTYFKSILRKLRRYKKYCLQQCQSYLRPVIDFKEHLLSNHSHQIRYIVLAPHIIHHLSNYIDTDYLAFHYVPHPAFFADSTLSTQSFPFSQASESEPDSYPIPKLKCAIFGYGNPPILYRLNQALTQLWQNQARQNLLNPNQPNLNRYLEIRIIGSNHQSTKQFSWVSTPIKHRTLSRLEMEELVQDIDLFLILYEPYRYQLSCSGSIIEALAYQKPILFLDNPCIQAFSLSDQPIGQSFNTVQDLALGLLTYINHPEQRKAELEAYRNHISLTRRSVDIKFNLDLLSSALGLSSHD